MFQGRTWPSESRTFTDAASGVTVRQLTNYKGHSHHLYFTNPGWYDGGRRMLFGSDRDNRSNLFSIELASGQITQLTDLEPLPAPHELEFLTVCVNPIRDEAYFRHGRQMRAIDLDSLQQRVLYEIPDGFVHSMANVTADGRYVCEGIYQDLSGRFRVDLLRGYVGFAEIHDAHPESRILRAAVDGSGVQTVWQENYWIGHVNTSPTQPHLVTFCHEGPWQKVDNRIWCLDISTGRAWKVRPRQGGEIVGHEYWHADGTHIGYHGAWPDGRKFFGRIRHDNTDRKEVAFPHTTGHIHSNDFSLIVGDGGKHIRLWKWTGDGFDGPRILCEHYSSMNIQQAHPHPRFTPDGRQVVFTTDRSGYCNVHMVDVPSFESLPMLKE
jgi:oligogalacturonide lyase